MVCFCVGGKREHLPTAAWSHCCHGQGHTMKQKETGSGVFRNDWLNAPVDATSENVLFWCFGFIEMWCQFIRLPGRKLVISLCQTRISTHRHYSHSTKCPGVPSPASGLVCPPPFPHPWGTRLIIVKIPIRGIGGGLIYCTFDIFALSGTDSLSPHLQLSRAFAKNLVSK